MNLFDVYSLFDVTPVSGHEMHWDFSDPGKSVAVPKPEAGY